MRKLIQRYKITGMKLVVIGIIIFTPCFIWQFFKGFDAVPLWFFCISAIPAGILMLTGLLWMWTKQDNDLDDTLEETMRERNNYR